MIRRLVTRVHAFVVLWHPRRCDYCRTWFASADLWVCSECTEQRCASWYAADCPPIDRQTAA